MLNYETILIYLYIFHIEHQKAHEKRVRLIIFILLMFIYLFNLWLKH